MRHLHFRDIRLLNNAGMSFPTCKADAKLLDTECRLPVTPNTNEVTCPKCLKKMKPPIKGLAHLYSSRWDGLRWGASMWREAFGYSEKLPQQKDCELVEHIQIESGEIVQFILKPYKRGSRKHRVFVRCICGEEVPAGRVHQHVCK